MRNMLFPGSSKLTTLILVVVLSVIAVCVIVYLAWPSQLTLEVLPSPAAGPVTPAQQTLEKATTLCQAGMFDKAIATLEQHHEEYAGEVIVLPTLAKLYIQTGNMEKAAALVDEILELAPNNAKVWWLKGELDYVAGEDPLPSFKKAAEITPVDSEIAGMYGVELFKLKRIDESRKFINQAVATGEGDTNVYLAAGLIAKIDGKDQQAMELLEKSLKLDPKNGAAWIALADVQKKLSMETAVVNSLKKALDYGTLSQRQNILLELANALAVQKKWGEAGNYYEQASEDRGSLRLMACTEAAKCYWRAGKFGAAMKNIDSAYELDPKNPETLAWRAKIENSRFGEPKTKSMDN